MNENLATMYRDSQRELYAENERLRELLRAALLEMDTHAIDCTLDAQYDEPCTCNVPALRRRIEEVLRVT